LNSSEKASGKPDDVSEQLFIVVLRCFCLGQSSEHDAAHAEVDVSLDGGFVFATDTVSSRL
jgi:hypothetical protein